MILRLPVGVSEHLYTSRSAGCAGVFVSGDRSGLHLIAPDWPVSRPGNLRPRGPLEVLVGHRLGVILGDLTGVSEPPMDDVRGLGPHPFRLAAGPQVHEELGPLGDGGCRK